MDIDELKKLLGNLAILGKNACQASVNAACRKKIFPWQRDGLPTNDPPPLNRTK
jgi:hypothetical protein